MIIGRMSWRITLLQPVKTADGMGGSSSSLAGGCHRLGRV